MATFITHIVLSDKVFDKYFPEKDLSNFIVGTNFPDIRLLKVVEREETHQQHITLADVKAQDNSFHAGLQYHSLIDLAREKFVVDNSLYDLVPKSKYITHSLKLFEDIVLYDRVDNWQKYVSAFDYILEEERDYGVSDEDITRWHKLVKDYIAQPPTYGTIEKLFEDLGFPSEPVNEVVQTVKQISEIPEAKLHAERLYDELEKILGESN